MLKTNNPKQMYCELISFPNLISTSQTWFQASAAKWNRTALFWVVTLKVA